MQTQEYAQTFEGIEDRQENPDEKSQPVTEYDVYIQEDRVTFVKKSPRQSGNEGEAGRETPYYISLVLSLLVLFSTLFMQSSSASTSTLPVVIVTIIPKTQTITTTQSIQIPARTLGALTLSQQQSSHATGYGHQ